MKARYKAATIVAAASMAVAPAVTNFEGVQLRAYADRLAYGIPTVCAGETEGVKLGDIYTLKQCAEMLQKKLPRYGYEIAACIKVPLSIEMMKANISISYNIGTPAFCKSTIVKRLNAGDYAGSCEAMLMWTQAGGKFRQGLLNRREAERQMCLDGI